jgi:hypothetical protein
MTTSRRLTEKIIYEREDHTAFDARFIVFARKLALLGLSHAEIAKNLGADRHTFNNWRHLYPDFDAAIDAGRVIADYEVVEALYKRCVGFEHEMKIFRDGREVINREYFPPDVAACKWWLVNRCPSKWKPESKLVDATPPGADVLNARPIEYPMKTTLEPETDDATVTEHAAQTDGPDAA